MEPSEDSIKPPESESSGEIALPFAAQSHDGFFKAAFSQTEHAIAFFQRHLPAAIAQQLDWQTLVHVNGSFVDPEFRQSHCDLLFSVFPIHSPDTPLHIYLLFEHQAKPDRLMPFRMLGYVMEIYRTLFKKKAKQLPPVIPLVLSQGPKEWKVSTEFSDMIAWGDLPQDMISAMMDYQPKFRHALCDLSRCNPAREETDPRLQVILELMKKVREKQQRELSEFTQWLLERSAQFFPEEFLNVVIFYELLHIEDELDRSNFLATLSESQSFNSRTMTIIEQWRAKDRREARAEGVEEGCWFGKIQQLEGFLGKKCSLKSALEALDLNELQAMHENLLKEFMRLFNR